MKYKPADELGVITRRSGIACYHQIYTLLERALTEGTIPPGGALPSETELMRRFQVSRNTVRRALGQLEEQKRIIRRRGSGSVARNGPAAGAWMEMLEDLWKDDEAMRLQTTSHLVRIHSSTTPEFIRRKEPLFGDRSLLIQRSRRFRNIPFMMVTSHVPQAVASRLTRGRLAATPVLVALHTLGIKAFSAEQVATAVAADSSSARHLGLEPGTPLLCVHRLIRDGTGRAIEHQSILYRSDRYQPRENLLLADDNGALGWLGTSLSRSPAWL